MDPSVDAYSLQLLVSLTAGFAALLEQMEDLKCKNTNLEQRLLHIQELHTTDMAQLASIMNSDSRSTNAREENRPEFDRPIATGDMMGTSQEPANDPIVAHRIKGWRELGASTGQDTPRNLRDVTEAPRACDIEDEGQLPTLSPKQHNYTPLTSNNKGCPFISVSKSRLGEQQSIKTQEPTTKRLGSLPTPPETRGQFIDDTLHPETRHSNISPPPTLTGSVSKCAQCPIRMLNERPPEEIAEYFESHKHEIPRSHEVCVKRYQRNEQGIRQLDAKYGSVVNMIQGLGVKHQPMLPHSDDQDQHNQMGARSIQKVQNWAADITEASTVDEEADTFRTIPSFTNDREGHFGRPFKEVRVGESPSRPWGISVPIQDSPSAPRKEQAPRTGEKAEQKPAAPPTMKGSNVCTGHPIEVQQDNQRQMIFTGPVFIGYSAEQAAEVIQRCGLGTQPQTS